MDKHASLTALQDDVIFHKATECQYAIGSDTRIDMNAKIREMNVRNRTDMSLVDIAKWCNPILRGWINYYGKFYRTALMPVLEHFNETLVKLALRKYINLRYKYRGWAWLKRIMKESPKLFVHWDVLGYVTK